MLGILRSQSNGNSSAINGRGLRRRKLTLDQRIDLAADFVSGQRQLVPSFKHAAALLRTTPTQVRERLKWRAQREARWRGAERRLQVQEGAEMVNAEAEILADAWRSTSAEAHEAAVQMIGPGAVWDAIARVIA